MSLGSDEWDGASQEGCLGCQTGRGRRRTGQDHGGVQGGETVSYRGRERLTFPVSSVSSVESV